MGRKKIIYTHVGLTTFAEKDLAILQAHFEVTEYYFNNSVKFRMPFSFIAQFFFLAFKMWKHKAIIVQFAGYHSWLPVLFAKLFRKKAIIVLGGTDTVSFPSIKYGSLRKIVMATFTKSSLKMATLLLPVSDTLVKYDYSYTYNDYPQQGYLAHAPRVTTPYLVVENGYDVGKWTNASPKEQYSFVTVGANLETTYGKKLKGIDLIIEVAEYFPDCTFYIVGGQKLKEVLPPNVIALKIMTHEELPTFMSTKQFYLQLSISEGFPNALCEAMLSGCVPIVSNVAAMPSIVKGVGYILPKKDLNDLRTLMQTALDEYSPSRSAAARKRISTNYPLERRIAEFTKAISDHLDH